MPTVTGQVGWCNENPRIAFALRCTCPGRSREKAVIPPVAVIEKWEFVFYGVCLVFAAGGAWAQFRAMRKDLNGVGKKLNSEIESRRRERERMRFELLEVAPEGKRDELIARFIKD